MKLCSLCKNRERRIYKNGHRCSWCIQCEKKKLKEYYKKNKKIRIAKTIKWQQENPEKIWRKINPEAFKNWQKNYRRNIRWEVIEKMGGECVCCGEHTYQFLSIDHINGGGCKHRKEIKSDDLTVWIKRNNYPKGFQILCYNCHMAKDFYGGCPHKE